MKPRVICLPGDVAPSAQRYGTFPLYIGYGDQTHELEEVKVGVLAEHFSDLWIQRYPGVHHFDPPAEIYTAAHANALRGLWQRAENQPLKSQLSLQK